MEEVLEEKKIYKKFSDYYQDPVFKAKHDTYVSTKVECVCGQMVARYNIAKHRKTKKHRVKAAEREALKIIDI